MAGRSSPEPWIVRETLYGRWTTFSRRRQAGILVGAVLAVSGLVGMGLIIASSFPSGSDSRTDQAADTEIRDAPKPTLILPTGEPIDPEERPPSSSSSPSRSDEPSHDKDSPRPKPPKKPADPDPVTYSAWAGHGCSSPAGGGYDEDGRYDDGIEGWYNVSTGGYGGGSCDTSFAAVPMSGSDTQDGHNRVLWWWSVGDDSEECTVAVYVPNGDGDRDVAGSPTVYEVLSGPDDQDTTYASFYINQSANRGRLVDAGTYPVDDGRIAVRMLDRGQDWNDHGPTYAHHAAGQMKVTCQAS
ncbi:adhesin [Streptomyces sp. NPDC004647]|uniref:adhesin n=1 Tax=Streptomyces sp. NPDC004647 TaxID=3154671 RepID=UPI0033B3A647